MIINNAAGEYPTTRQKNDDRHKQTNKQVTYITATLPLQPSRILFTSLLPWVFSLPHTLQLPTALPRAQLARAQEAILFQQVA